MLFSDVLHDVFITMMQDTEAGDNERAGQNGHLTGNLNNRTSNTGFSLADFSFPSPFIKDKQLVFKRFGILDFFCSFPVEHRV